jgi:thiol:disulfide interchange protein
LWGLLVAAFVGGLLMVFTPCVFPMIPITVNFFIKQAEKEHHRPLFLASVYSGTIVVLLTLTVVAFGQVVVELAEDPWFNLALGGVMVFFALSLFGMYEIELPSFLSRFTSAREGQGGAAGAFFMALTFTITSFTCTGPFLGIMLAPYAELRPPFTYRLLSALVYSATFAAPFFFLALFPTLLRKLPKSGGWMNAIKVTMGFVELAAALKFLANTDYLWFPGRPRFFTYDAVLCSWIAISFATGLYLMGLFRLPHDDAQEHIGVVRMIFGTVFFGLTLYMLPLLFGGKPTGIVGEGLQAFLPPRLSQGAGLAGGGKKEAGEHLSWHTDFETAWKEAVAQDKLLFIDFTGVLCTNCRANEENVFPLAPVIEELKKYVRVQLYTDSVPDSRLSASESVEAARQNKRWRNNLLKDTSLPYYVILKPDPKKPYDGDFLLGDVIDKRRDLIRDEKDFIQFLKSPVAARVLVAAPDDAKVASSK